MEKVVAINIKKKFTLAEAQDLLPLIIKITKDSSEHVKPLISQAEVLSTYPRDERLDSLEARINELVERWQTKIEKLGALPKGLWLVDFDNGQGYFCWKFPERKILYQHGYQDGFSGRIKIYDEEPQPTL